MTKLSDSITENLGLPTVIEEEATEVVVAEPGTGDVISEKVIDDDAALARKNITKMVEEGSDMLETAILVAEDSEHPRAFEVVGGLIKTLTESNLALLDIQAKKKALKTRTVHPEAPHNNNVFLTTEALQEMLKGK
tara:strand:- start:19719 stop:20126 length:408 start_codon:yes stop_codon:yes gene_type:complete